ncbi:MAG: FAD-dependent oxidoreductase [Methylococcales bacterium]|nr:FAD-dependent oxidoreductase [Methylococcales bacterium]
MIMTTHSDITIIGGGIIGLLTARAWAQKGASVTLLEQGRTGRESSWAGGGILSPLYPWRQAEAINQLAAQSQTLYPTLCAELREATGIDPELRYCGLLIPDAEDGHEAISWCQRYRIEVSTAPPELPAALNVGGEQLLWMPTIGQVRNPRLLQALHRDLERYPITRIEQCQISSAQVHRQRITEVQSRHHHWPVNELIVCAGAWTQQLLAQLLPTERAPAITPVKGQMLAYSISPDVLPCMVLAGDHYLIPRQDGLVLVGSTVEQEGFDKTPTRKAKALLEQLAHSLLPTLRTQQPKHHWAGLRPGSATGIPTIGRHPELTNLSINAGHFRNGLVMAPASVNLLLELMTGTSPTLAAEPYQWQV